MIARSRPQPPLTRPTAVALATLLLAALALRLFGLNWDDGHYLHPDERYVADVTASRIHLDWPPSIGALLDPKKSGLNPRSANPENGSYREFPYGALPLLVTDSVAEVCTWVSDTDWHAYGQVYRIGRAISALLDTLTVLVVFLIGARVYSRRVGLFGAAVACGAPMSIQLAHFFTTDSWLTFFVAVCLYAAVRAGESGRSRWFSMMGAAFGLAMATKGSVFGLAGLVLAAVIYDVWRRSMPGSAWRIALLVGLRRLALAGLSAVAAFALFEPYALVNPAIYLTSLRTQSDIARGVFDVPFTRLYIGTPPLLYQATQLVRWGFGPVAGLLSLGGLVLVARMAWRYRTAGQALVLAWFLGYGVIIAVPETKFLRYLSPLIPVLALSAGVALDALWRWLGHLTRPLVAATVVGLLLLGMGGSAAAFSSVYRHENTRLQASRWVYTSVSPGSSLTSEYWDDELPVELGTGLTYRDRQYQHVSMDLYADRPPADVADEIYRTLSQVDYVVISSNRLMASIPRSPWRYPVQTRYYELLRSGQLGFLPVSEFARPPRIGPVVLRDDGADESLINYDHPHVLIYKKASLVDRVAYRQMMSWAIQRPWSPNRHQGRPTLLLDEPVGNLPVVSDARWSERLTSHSVGALGVWIIFLVLLQMIGRPTTGWIFRGFADRGWGLSRLVGLLLSGYLVWLLASLRLAEFRAIWCWVTLASVLLVSIALKRKHAPGLAPLDRETRRTAWSAEAVFWIVFATFLLFRYLNPDSWHPFWGGEKPMEFAHINATLRSAYFPPFDPWYADGYINYYYYGLYLVAFCLKATGIPSEIGFNLAQPTVMALLASAGFTVAATIARDITRRPRVYLASGWLVALFLVGMGNLSGIVQLLNPNRAPFGDFGYWVWDGSRAVDGGITEFPFFTGLYADLHAHVVALPITILAIALGYAIAADSWRTTARLDPMRREWSRYAGRLLMLSLVLGTLYATNAWDVPVYAALGIASIIMSAFRYPYARWRALVAIGSAVTLSAVAYILFLPFLNHYVALFSSVGRVRSPTRPAEFATHLGGLGAICLISLVPTMTARSDSRVNQYLRPASLSIALVTIWLAGRLLAPGHAEAANRLGVLFAILLGSGLGVVAWQQVSAKAAWWSMTAIRAILLVGLIAALVALASGWTLLAVCSATAAATLVAWVRSPTPARQYSALMVLAASLVAAGTELFFVVDNLATRTDAAYRMNTVFKFYDQIWVLLAVAGAALLSTLLNGVQLSSGRFRPSWSRNPSPRTMHPGWPTMPSVAAGDETNGAIDAIGALRREWAWLGIAVTGVVVALSMLYPVFAISPRLHQRFTDHLGSGTLNALDWMDYGLVADADGHQLSFTGDRAAVNWFNHEVDGSPVIAEASIGPYRGNGSRISIGTGLPTIIGWASPHEEQQRDNGDLSTRVADTQRLYQTTDRSVKLDILRRYNVEYVVVGDIERTWTGGSGRPYASAAGLAAFDAMVGSDLDVAFQSGATTVYRVRPAGPR